MPAESIPAAADGYRYRVAGWVREAVQEGDLFLAAQAGFRNCDDAIQSIMGPQNDLYSLKLSRTSVNQVANLFFDMTAGLTDTKPFWEYATDNPRYKTHCAIFGKLANHVWQTRSMDIDSMFCMQYAIACGASYLEPYWDPEIEDFRAEAWDPRDILPIRPTTSGRLQDCYGVVARKARSVNHLKYLAREVYKRPDLAGKIKATRTGTMTNANLQASKIGQLLDSIADSPFSKRFFGNKAVREIPKIATADLYTVYVNDKTRNESDSPVAMGDWNSDGSPGNNWSYIVMPGEKLYPRKRMIVCVDSLEEPLYDGPSIWWHGMFPYAKLSLDIQPFSWFGKGPVWDILELNRSLDKNLRVYDDWLERLAQPAKVADSNVIGERALAAINTRKAGGSFRINMRMAANGKPLEFIDPGSLPIDFWKGIEYKEQKMRELTGAADANALMQLNQIPSSDTVEKILNTMSGKWRLRSRTIEQTYIREFATQMYYNFAQFYPLDYRVMILGPQAITSEDFDSDRGTMIPDFVHAEDFVEAGNPSGQAMSRGPRERYTRAKEFLKQFTFKIASGSLLASSEIERKMMYLQLSRMQLVDPWTLAEVLNIPNYGQPPAQAITIPQRLVAAQEMGLIMSNNAAGQASNAGRKASGQETPRLVVKES